MLVFLLLLPLAGTTEISAPAIIFKAIQRCPDVGYFFQRDKSSEFGPCYLCFCKGGDKAVCSKRPSGKCDSQYYIHETRKTRISRSLSFNDIFFRDAAREVFDTKLTQQEECKPLRSSKSIGCPPEDWCTGCMVCDCDANGHWDCHIMSFCSNDKPSSAEKLFSKAKPQKPRKGKRNLSQQSQKRFNKKKSSVFKKIDKMGVTYGNNGNSGKKKIAEEFSLHPTKNLPETIISVQTKRRFRSKKKTRDAKSNNSPMVIKKYISTMSPIKSPELLKYKNDKNKLAQMLYKQFMSNPNKSPKNNQKASQKNIEIKIMNKQTSIKKHNKQTKKNMGNKIINRKAANKKNIKQTKQNTRKSMFNKGSKDIPKIIPINTKHTNKNNNDTKRNNSKIKQNANMTGKKYKDKKFKNKGSKLRRKRHALSSAAEVIENSTHIEITDDETTAYVNHTTDATEITFTNNEFKQQTLNNYAYSVDKNVTTSMINNQSVYNVTGYGTTENNIDIVTIYVKNFIKRDNNISKESAMPENVKKLVTLIDSELKTSTATTYPLNGSVKELNFIKAPKSEFNVIIDKSMKAALEPNQTVNSNLTMKQKVYGQDIKKIITNTKKFNVKKLVKNFNDGLNIKNHRLLSRDLSNKNNMRYGINNSPNDIQTVLEKILKTATNNNTKLRSDNKHFKALKYIRNLYSKLFPKGRNKTTIDKVGVMNTVCDNFGPCNLSVKKLQVVNYKVKELISETQKALNSIKIIKGLLQLINSEKKENGNATIKEANFKMHVRHLNAILKDNYIPVDQLTSTEVTQINYVKSNTKVFIKSIAKFRSILNDIINIIKSENTKNKHRNRTLKNNLVNKQENSVNKLRNLLLKYNIIQNTFLRKMYEALTKLEVKLKLQHANMSNNDIQPANNETYKMAIAKYVQNINENLKKLQDLASRVDFKQRRKRHATKDDDAIEYLLTLMEYLLKRHNLQDTSPANDGIDLLIEAIRNAPEIKPIKKKVLQYVPVKIKGVVNSAESKEESNVHTDNSIKTKDFSDNLNSNIKNKSYEDQSDNDDPVEDKRQIKSYSTEKAVTTTKTYSVADLSDIVTEYQSKVYMATYYTEKNTARPFFEKRVTNAETTTKTVKPSKENNTKKTVEINSMDDENDGLMQKARDFESVSQMDSTTLVSSTENEIDNTKLRHFVPLNSEYKDKSIKEETKTKLDLINEAYEKEIKEERAHTTAKTPKSRAKGETGKRNKKPFSSNVSSVTKEIIDDEKEKINEAEVIYKKQLDLLNSLDYGTDKPAAEDSDSKDNSPVDRLSKDAFPSYFV